MTETTVSKAAVIPYLCDYTTHIKQLPLLNTTVKYNCPLFPLIPLKENPTLVPGKEQNVPHYICKRKKNRAKNEAKRLLKNECKKKRKTNEEYAKGKIMVKKKSYKKMKIEK